MPTRAIAYPTATVHEALRKSKALFCGPNHSASWASSMPLGNLFAGEALYHAEIDAAQQADWGDVLLRTSWCHVPPTGAPWPAPSASTEWFASEEAFLGRHTVVSLDTPSVLALPSVWVLPICTLEDGATGYLAALYEDDIPPVRFEAKVFLALDFTDPAAPRALYHLGFGAIPVRAYPGDFDSRCPPFRFPRGGAFSAAEVREAGATHLSLIRRNKEWFPDLSAWAVSTGKRMPFELLPLTP